jgi:hypothetical protein
MVQSVASEAKTTPHEVALMLLSGSLVPSVHAA